MTEEDIFDALRYPLLKDRTCSNCKHHNHEHRLCNLCLSDYTKKHKAYECEGNIRHINRGFENNNYKKEMDWWEWDDKGRG